MARFYIQDQGINETTGFTLINDSTLKPWPVARYDRAAPWVRIIVASIIEVMSGIKAGFKTKARLDF
jgi:hypothetical protein